MKTRNICIGIPQIPARRLAHTSRRLDIMRSLIECKGPRRRGPTENIPHLLLKARELETSQMGGQAEGMLSSPAFMSHLVYGLDADSVCWVMDQLDWPPGHIAL